MKLPGDLGKLDFTDWAYGLLAAFIGGGASAVTSGLTLNVLDPKDFNVYSSKIYVLMGGMFLVNGIMSGFAFLRQNPLPVLHTKERTVQLTEQAGEPTTKVTTVKDTIVAPVQDVKEKL